MDIIRANHNVLGLTLLQGMLAMSSKPEIEAVLVEFPENMKAHPLYIQLEEMLEPIKADLGMPYWDMWWSVTACAMCCWTCGPRGAVRAGRKCLSL